MCQVTSVMSNSFATQWTITHQAPVSMGFPRQEYWSQLPCPPPWDLPKRGIDPVSPMAPALQVDSLLLRHWGSPQTSPHMYAFLQLAFFSIK